MLKATASVIAALLCVSEAYAQQTVDDSQSAPSVSLDESVVLEESPEPEPAAASEQGADPNSPAARRTLALERYSIGEEQEAFDLLKDLIRQCAELGEEKCSDKVEAVLYRDMGIVLAGGLRRHDAAVRSFKQALRRNPKIGLIPDLRSSEVDAAYIEAKGGQPPPPPVYSERPRSASSEPVAFEVHNEWDKHFFVSVNGSFGMGVGIPTVGILPVSGIIQLGGNVMLGGVLDSGLLLAGRSRVVYAHILAFDSGISVMGSAFMIGKVKKARHKGWASYSAGGIGAELYPAGPGGAFTIHALWGLIMSGVGVGLALDTSINGGEVDMLLSFNLGPAGVF